MTVVQMDEWLIEKLPEQAQYILRNGREIQVVSSTGKGYQGPLSECPDYMWPFYQMLLELVRDALGSDYRDAIMRLIDTGDHGHCFGVVLDGEYLAHFGMEFPRDQVEVERGDGIHFINLYIG